jgi:hypothetical protein
MDLSQAGATPLALQSCVPPVVAIARYDHWGLVEWYVPVCPFTSQVVDTISLGGEKEDCGRSLEVACHEKAERWKRGWGW